MSTARPKTALITSTPTKTPPSTAGAKQSLTAVPPPSPGTWRHPKFTEIIARESKSKFSDKNLRNALTNAAALVLSLILSPALSQTLSLVLSLLNLPQSSSIIVTGLSLLRLFFAVNIVLALRPLIPYLHTKDEVLDIPLTPSQRSLLGLPPSPSSLPGSDASASAPKYITPPRYHRSSSSFTPSPLSSVSLPPTTDRRSTSANFGSSPISSPRPPLGFSPNSLTSSLRNSPVSGINGSPSASPLFQRGLNYRGPDTSRLDESFGSSTGLGRSQSVTERSSRASGGRESEIEFDTPSPPVKVKRNPGLNYKWLYEKGKRLPKRDSMQF